MSINKLSNYFSGYVTFKLEGLNLERVINLAADNGIVFWDIVRKDYTTIEGKIRAREYKKLKKIIKKSGCRSKITMKVGYPFFIYRLRRKKILLVGLFLSIFIVIMFSSFIWSINIYGNNEVADNEIIETLKKNGLYIGSFKYKLNLNEIKDNIIIEHDEIVWVGLQLKGTVVNINIVEKKEVPEKIHDDVPCDIVAKKNGIIEKVIARKGDEAVKKGDIVKKNQVLISGTIIRDYNTIRYVHSEGEVYAKTYYEKVEKVPIHKIIKTKTGNKYSKKTIMIGDYSLTLSNDSIPFDNYIVEKKNKKLTIWRNIKIPVEILIEDYYEVTEDKKKIPISILKESLKEKLLIELVNQIPEDVEIINKEISFSINDNFVVGELIIETIEQIGTKNIIDIKPEIQDDEKNKEE